jgi:hypothetical protein
MPLQGCRLFLRSASPQLPPSSGDSSGVAALLQSVYPPLSLAGVQALLARACREVELKGALLGRACAADA